MVSLGSRAAVVTITVCLTWVLAVPALPAGAVRYDDVTDISQIRFQTAGEIHLDGEFQHEWPGFAEIFGGGACFGDFDGDGWQDLFIANHRYNTANPAAGAWVDTLDPRDRLYINNGDGTFRDATDAAGIDGRGLAYSCSTADADGDGDLDLFVGHFGADRFLVNDGHGRFVDRSVESNIAADALCLGAPCVTMSSAWADYDSDGDVDLYVANYVETNHTDNDRGPERHNGQHNRLYDNDGTGVFTERALAAGVAGNPTDEWGSKSFQPVWDDFDGDGDLDIYVTNDLVPNDYYENLGNGQFVERSNETGLGDDRAGMGLTTGDIDGDCLPDLFFTHYEGELNGFYRNRGDGTFQDISGSGEHNESLPRVGWGTHFVDADLDGDEDILTTNGHTEWFLREYAQQIELFRNDPVPGQLPDWTAIHHDSGPSFDTKWVGRGLSVADFDLDGDIDFFITPNGNQTATLHRASEVSHNWLRLELRGTGGNTHGIGARIDVTANGVTQCKRVLAGSGFLGQNDLGLTFGLAQADTADVTVHWPNGSNTTFSDLNANHSLRLHEATGFVQEDTLAPRTRVVADVPGGPEWWRTPVTVTLDTTDEGVTEQSGVVSREHKLNDGDWTPYSDQSYTFSDQGIDTIWVRSSDAAGNREPERALKVGRDFAPPRGVYEVYGALGDNGWRTSETVSVTLRGFDDLSGVKAIHYRIDHGDWQTYDGPIRFNGTGGVYTVTYSIEDHARNTSPHERILVKHDPTAPTVDLHRPAASQLYVQNEPLATLPIPPAIIVGLGTPTDPDSHTFTLRSHAGDNVSGLARHTLWIDGEPVTRTARAVATWDWDLDGASGNHTISASARDKAGNTASVDRTVYVVGADASEPTGTDPAGFPVVSVAALFGIAGLVRVRRHTRPPHE